MMMYLRFSFVVVLCGVISDLKAQMTISVMGVPAYYTPMLDDIYISGTFNNWAVADTTYRLQRQADNSYRINLYLEKGKTYQYKFTRGTEASIEVSGDGTAIAPRQLVYLDKGGRADRIEAWGDMYHPTHSANNRVRVLASHFKIPQLNRERRIWIWLPHDYDNNIQKTYPVLYMHDGQNIFDAATSYAGEWGVDEAMSGLTASGVESAIVVGIDNGEGNRLNEYTVWPHPRFGGGEGEAYMDFVVNTLKPFIDKSFRTQTDREHTLLMGSSLGGLISYYALLKYPKVFGKIGLFSPSFWYNRTAIQAFAEQQKHSDPMRIYMLCGEQEDADMVPDMQAVYSVLRHVGFSEAEINYQTRPEGKHSEWFWKQEFAYAYRWLMAAPNAIPTKGPSSRLPLIIKYELNGENLYIGYPYPETITSTIMQDAFGHKVYEVASGVSEIPTKLLRDAWYVVTISTPQGKASQRIYIQNL